MEEWWVTIGNRSLPLSPLSNKQQAGDRLLKLIFPHFLYLPEGCTLIHAFKVHPFVHNLAMTNLP